MSAQTIARWHAIPMVRPENVDEQEHQSSSSMHMKRPRTDDEDSEDDNISLVSRTPSPAPTDVMDVGKYDEYVRGAPREVITVETKIKSTNKGFAMLTKLGWSEGQPLGLTGEGRVDPIPFQVKNDLTGLGKTNQDFRMIETTVSQRRVLDSERQRKETEDQRRAREDSVARQLAVRSEISDTLKPFYCSLCEKQFQNVAQYDEHTNSYAHHHKARLRDMQANARLVNQEELGKRKEKERKREEKELRKLAKAAGIKMARPPVAAGAAAVPSMVPVNAAGGSNEGKSPGFKKAGWATVTTPSTEAGSNSGWASINPSSAQAGPPPPPPFPTPPSKRPTSNAPLFRTAGWTSLDTGGYSTPSLAPPPPPPPAPVSTPPAPACWNVPYPPSDPPPLPSHPLPAAVGGWKPASRPISNNPTPPIAPSGEVGHPSPTPPRPPLPGPPNLHFPPSTPTPPPPQAKSGWQQWKQANKRR
ncbi:hypothetical protein F5I97DRAFT_1613733 [Phlebopus sp. FC_14]|nr:hypothetical protein F5I97DRAFT_1613733 [Phlebopus sp. FC_14]